MNCEERDPQTGKVPKRALAGRLRLRKLPDKSAASIDRFAKDCIASGAAITTDDGSEFTNCSGSIAASTTRCRFARSWAWESTALVRPTEDSTTATGCTRRIHPPNQRMLHRKDRLGPNMCQPDKQESFEVRSCPRSEAPRIALLAAKCVMPKARYMSALPATGVPASRPDRPGCRECRFRVAGGRYVSDRPGEGAALAALWAEQSIEQPLGLIFLPALPHQFGFQSGSQGAQLYGADASRLCPLPEALTVASRLFGE